MRASAATEHRDRTASERKRLRKEALHCRTNTLKHSHNKTETPKREWFANRENHVLRNVEELQIFIENPIIDIHD